MRTFFYLKRNFISTFVAIFCSLLCMLGMCGCSKSVDYFSYVSELRSNILVAKSTEYYLRIYATNKESPYSADGIPREKFDRTEIYLSAPNGDGACVISFTVNDKTYSGEMSYDNARGEYYYYCSLDSSNCDSISCKIICNQDEFVMNAHSVLDGSELSAKELLKQVKAENGELFTSMTDKYGFIGEIYMRLIYEDAPYYYVGIIDRDGNIHAFLLNAKTGKILAKR